MKKELREVINKLSTSRRQEVLTMFNSIEHEFMETPASTKYHGNYLGGLFDHTMNVIKISKVLYATLKPEFTLESLIFCALVHDIGKIGSKEEPMYNILVNASEPGYCEIKYNPRISPNMNHEQWTIYYLMKFKIQVSAGELFAIINHAGPYTQWKTETPLQLMLHSADNLSAKVSNL